jgi:hypothetical protein
MAALEEVVLAGELTGSRNKKKGGRDGLFPLPRKNYPLGSITERPAVIPPLPGGLSAQTATGPLNTRTARHSKTAQMDLRQENIGNSLRKP